jgi:uncharacterized membrane protein YraQ (UPF0718 family)
MIQAIVIGFVVGLMMNRLWKKLEKHVSAKTLKPQPQHPKLSKNDEELITAILPVINKH